MAVYRTIQLSFWTDSKVDDEFTPEDKYFYLYLLTNPHTNICGCYEIGEKQCSRETGYNTETISRLLYRFEHVHDVIRYNAKTKEVLILNWHKYNWTKSEDLKRAVSKVAENIKTDAFREYIFSLLEDSPKTVSTPSQDPPVTSVTDTITVNTDSVSGRKRKDNRGVGEEEKGKPDAVEVLFGYNEFLLEAIRDWIAYKKEKRQGYGERGLKSLLTQLKNRVAEYGEDAVIEVIQESMAANYMGITWDKLKNQNRQQKPGGGYSFMDILKQEEQNESHRNS